MRVEDVKNKQQLWVLSHARNFDYLTAEDLCFVFVFCTKFICCIKCEIYTKSHILWILEKNWSMTHIDRHSQIAHKILRQNVDTCMCVCMYDFSHYFFSPKIKCWVSSHVMDWRNIMEWNNIWCPADAAMVKFWKSSKKTESCKTPDFMQTSWMATCA